MPGNPNNDKETIEVVFRDQDELERQKAEIKLRQQKSN